MRIPARLPRREFALAIPSRLGVYRGRGRRFAFIRTRHVHGDASAVDLRRRSIRGAPLESGVVDMTFPSSCRIHPTAVISPETELGENVEIGAFAFIEGKVRIGADSIIRPGAYLYGPLTMGRGNTIYTGAVLGEKPQTCATTTSRPASRSATTTCSASTSPSIAAPPRR